MKLHPICSALLLAAGLSTSAADQPNVIFFAVDDLCDWVGPLGHEQAITPNMDQLARRGVVFSNAHCPGTFCAPSRSAIFTGRYASTTGCYTTEVYFHDHPNLRPLQVSFKEGGYATFGAGKLFHHPAGYLDLRGWDEFFVRSEKQKREGWALDSWGDGTPIPEPYPNSAYNQDRKPANRFFLEWGAVPNEREEAMADTLRVNWACDLLRQGPREPFFLAVGLYAPHFPNYAPQRYFDLYDVEKIKAPPYNADDLDDLPPKVSLIDMYPTFVQMCGLPTVEGLEGKSLAATLRDPRTATDRNVYVPYLDPGGYAVINQQWRYIHYRDDTEELYNVREDPNEWYNLAEDESYAAVKQELQADAPETFAPIGTPKQRRRLVVDGSTYRWEAR